MAIERTLILIKPDGVQRGIVGNILSRFETCGLKLVGMKLMQMTEADVRTSLGLDAADVGYHVIDADSGAVLTSRHADAAFPPASTAKLATMIAALGILGPEYRFRTKLLARGTLKDGMFNGDIVLQGDGDPLFSANDLRALAVRLADIGIKKVEGHFFYHSTLPVFADIAPGQPIDAPC